MRVGVTLARGPGYRQAGDAVTTANRASTRGRSHRGQLGVDCILRTRVPATGSLPYSGANAGDGDTVSTAVDDRDTGG